jgi:hypothetical protein
MDGRNGFSVHETPPPTGSPSYGWLSGDFAHGNN